VLPVGALFAFIGKQLGRVLTLAFGWATTALFGRVPESQQLLLSATAGAALAWPVVLAGVAVPSVATFLLAFVTLPEWANAWVRPVMLALAIALPLAVGYLSTRILKTHRRSIALEVLRGFPVSIGLFIVLVWMIVLAPLTNIVALLRRWQAAHVAIAVKPGGYDTVVRDLVAALERAELPVTARRASWAYEVPGRVLRAFAGSRVSSLIPERLVILEGAALEVVVHPVDLSLRGAKVPLARARAAIARELTFTAANQTWSPEAQRIEDRLAEAAKGRADLDAVAAQLQRTELDFEEWQILYRLLLQVRLRLSPLETDALEPRTEPIPTRDRLAGLANALRALWPARRAGSPRGD